jgi:precorrin-6B methylase 2
MFRKIVTPAHVFFALIVVAGLAGMTYAQVRLDVPYVPTPLDVVEKMLDMARLAKDDYHIDLGSGDGRIVVAAAQRGARSMGVDINPTRIAEANENARKAKVTDRVTFVQANLFETKIGEANVLTMYLLQSVNLQLRPRILAELRPGSRVVSHAFSMNEWEPDQHERMNGRNLYLWIVPGKAEGTWEAEIGTRKVTLALKQTFQKVTGTATMDGKSIPVTGKLAGDMLELSADLGGGLTTLRGRIEGHKLEGENLRAKRS